MDAARFEIPSRALAAARSRRGLTGLLGGAVLGGPLAFGGLTGAKARKKRKKKKKARCRAGQTRCDGRCVDPCPDETYARRPDCRCCLENGFRYASPDQCCSGLPSPGLRCRGFSAGSTCEFNEQCASSVCRNGTCACPSGQKPCAGACIPTGQCCENRECTTVAGQVCTFGQCHCPPSQPDTCAGQCLAPCPNATYARRPNCECCIKNGFAYTTGVGQCCSDGAAANATCKGRAPGSSCDFHEQCASNNCLFSIFGNACQA